jgi:hypothetical protein
MRLLGFAMVVMTSACMHNAVSSTSPDQPPACTFDDRCVSGTGELDGVVSVAVASAAVITAIAFAIYQRAGN